MDLPAFKVISCPKEVPRKRGTVAQNINFLWSIILTPLLNAIDPHFTLSHDN